MSIQIYVYLIYEKEEDKNDNNEAADDREMKKWSALQTHF